MDLKTSQELHMTNKMMAEIFLLLNEVKSQAITSFWLTLSEINLPECNFTEDERAANPTVATTNKQDESSPGCEFFS